MAADLTDVNLKLPTLKANGGTNFQSAIEGGLRALRLTSDELTPILIFMTDGIGENLDEACKLLRDFAKTHRNLITISVGLGDDYQRSTLEAIADNGNRESKWWDLTQLFSRKKGPRVDLGDHCIKIGAEIVSLVVECAEPNSLIGNFKRIAAVLSGVGS